MAAIETLIHDILSPVEAAGRLGPKVLGWLEPTVADAAPAAWEWFDRSAPAGGMEVIECHLPGDVLQRLFGLGGASQSAITH